VKKTSKKRFIKFSIYLFLLLTYPIACANLPQGPPKDELKLRVMAYMAHRIKGEFDKSYTYEDPLYRKKVNEASYLVRMANGPFKWEEADIKEISVQGDQAIIQVNIRGQLRLRGFGSKNKSQIENQVELTWIRSEGIWYNSLQ
jgi:hypothetical protein